MTDKQALERLYHTTTTTDCTGIKRVDAYNKLKSDLKILEIIKKNAKLGGRFAKECDKDGNLTGVFSILEVILTGRNAEIIERWLENDK